MKIGHQTLSAYVLLLPTILPLIFFVGIPIIGGLYLSLTNFQPLSGQADFIGLANFEALFGDRLFQITLGNTIAFTIMFVPLTLVLGLGSALLLERAFRGVGFVRLAFYLPTLTTGVVVAFMTALVLQPNTGWLNVLLRAIGLPQVLWMSEPENAMFVLVGAAVWKSFGWAMIIYLAGLTAIPEELYEAARIDGAGRWQLIRHITLPLLRPVTLTVLVLLAIFSLQVFDIVAVLAEKWLPLESVTTMVHQIYLNAFKFNDGGFAAAMAGVLFAMIAAVSFVNYRIVAKDVKY